MHDRHLYIHSSTSRSPPPPLRLLLLLPLFALPPLLLRRHTSTPPCSFLPFVFRSLGLVTVVVPSTEPTQRCSYGASKSSRLVVALSFAGDRSFRLSPRGVGSSSTSLGAPLFGRRLQVKMVHLPSLVFSFCARLTHPIRFGWLVSSFIHSFIPAVCMMALIIYYYHFLSLVSPHITRA